MTTAAFLLALSGAAYAVDKPHSGIPHRMNERGHAWFNQTHDFAHRLRGP